MTFPLSEFTKKRLATEIATERDDFVLPAPVIALRNTLSSCVTALSCVA
jgi:hypothetical protein